MADKGIIFSAPMVRALLTGQKTQTRRLLKPAPEVFPIDDAGTLCDVGYLHVQGEDRPRLYTGRCLTAQKAAYAAGDRLYVRESWRISPDAAEGWHPEELRGWIDYQARGSEQRVAPSFEAVERAAFLKGDDRDWDFLPSRYRPCIHMPRWTSRLWLSVTDVRVQRLQVCSEDDAMAEGWPGDPGQLWPLDWYRDIWNSLHTAEGERWDDDPWVVAVTFDVHHGNIDQVQA